MVVFKKRYLLMEVVWLGTPLADSSSILSRLVVCAAIQESLQLNFGDHCLGSSLRSLQVCQSYYQPVSGETQSASVPQTMVCHLIHYLRKQPVVFNLLDISGNMKSCQKFIPKCESEKLKKVKLKL